MQDLDPSGFGQGWIIIWTLLLAPFSLLWYQLRSRRQEPQARQDSTTSTTSTSSRHQRSTLSRLLSPLHVALLALVSLLCTLCLMLLRSDAGTSDAPDARAIDSAYVQQGAATIKGIDVPPNRGGPRRRSNATRGPVVHGSAASYGGRAPPRQGGTPVSLPLTQAGVGLVIPYDELQMGDAIGRGSFGEVHKATRHGVHVAVKLLTNVDPNDPDSLNKLTNELLGVCEAPLALVTELCVGGNLEVLLHKGHQGVGSWKRRVLVALYVAQALEYLHLHNIQHNDIKASNVLLTNDMTVKLGDFGSAMQLEGPSDHSNAAANHNPRWLAPELIQHASGSFAADVYAFGVLLWELLVWDVPFGRTTKDAEVARRVVLEGWRPPLPETLPGGPCPPRAELESLMKHCWAQSPEDRPTAAAVVKTLEGIVHTRAST